jgi:hypothetical protein
MRVVFCGEHVQMADGQMHHSLTAPADLFADDLILAEADTWIDSLASLVGRCRASTPQVSTLLRGPKQAVVDPPTEPLFSWVIAPVPGRPNFRTGADAANA